MKSPSKRISSTAAAVLAASCLIWAAPASAQQQEVLKNGRIDFEENCAPCHGKSGMGEGKMAGLLTAKPPDLTRIAKRNGGEFPFWKIYETVDGETPSQAHQLSPMPIWGNRFRDQGESGVHPPFYVRILLITQYLESIQEK